ncbi:MAG TPA: nuclear transport factor 2 family protein [Polyangia bacterium]|nr:nuclear transport factor 2 family protein [Polyangia bacterium]
MGASVEQELIDLERQYWQAMKDGDAEVCGRLCDDPSVVAGASGVSQIDRATMVKMMGSGAWKLNAFELAKPIVRMLTDDVAVVAYKVHEDLTAEGKPVKLDAADTSIWVRRAGRWLCAVHTESIAGDPFGRDRAVPKK